MVDERTAVPGVGRVSQRGPELELGEPLAETVRRAEPAAGLVLAEELRRAVRLPAWERRDAEEEEADDRPGGNRRRNSQREHPTKADARKENRTEEKNRRRTYGIF